MASILFVIGHFQQPIQLQFCLKQKNFINFWLHIRNIYNILNILKKRYDPLRLCIAEISDCERRGYLNV